MDQEPDTGRPGNSSDSLLAAYGMLIETVVESDDDVLLQRSLEVIAAVRWPWSFRFLAACLPEAGSIRLRLAAIVVRPGETAPRCEEAESSDCLCALAQLRPDRLFSTHTTAPPAGPSAACGGPGRHLVLPLAARKRILGMLHILLAPGQDPSEPEQSFLVQVATLLGAELDRRRGEREHDRLELQFLQAQKTEAVGRLAGGVAHDFNNILTAITSYADLGLLKLPGQSPMRRNFEEILAAADRAALLTQQLLAFSHRQPLTPRIIDLGEILAGLDKPLRRVVRANIALSVISEPGKSPILADPSLIEQLVINLVIGARDALPRGGRLLIGTADADLDATFALGHPPVTPGRHLCLVLGVNGPELAAGELRAFCGSDAVATEPNPVALGPAAVREIVRQSGGYAHLDEADNDGVAVRIYFPVASRDPRSTVAPHLAGHLPRGRETILFAEDDDSVRIVVTEVLRNLGYEVLGARDGREALELAAAHPGRIDALVADMVMPGYGAVELRRRLAATRPTLRALYVSGAAEHPAALQSLADSDDLLLPKPFSPWALASRLRQALDAPRSAARTG